MKNWGDYTEKKFDEQCCGENCQAQATYVCPAHENEFYCAFCALLGHSDCLPERVGDPGELATSIIALRLLMNKLANITDLKLSSTTTAEYRAELEMFTQSAGDLEAEAMEAIRQDWYYKYKFLIKRAKTMKRTLDHSYIYRTYCSTAVAQQLIYESKYPYYSYLDDPGRKLQLNVQGILDDLHTKMNKEKDRILQEKTAQFEAANEEMNAKFNAIQEEMAAQIKALEQSQNKMKIAEASNQQTISQMQEMIDKLLSKEQEKKEKISALQNELKDKDSSLAGLDQERSKLENTVTDLESKNKKISSDNEEAHKENDKLVEELKEKEQQLEATTAKLSVTSQMAYSYLVSDIEDETVELDQNSTLFIDCSQPKWKQVIKSMKGVRLPALNELYINKPSNSDEDLKQFLASSFPQSLNDFIFNCDSKERIEVELYLPSLLPQMQRVSTLIYFNNCTMNSDSLSQLVRNSKHCAQLAIRCSKIVVDGDLDFGQHLQFNTHSLNLFGCGDSDESDWGSDSSGLEAIVAAIGNSGLKTSLTKIDISYCGVTVKQVEDMLKANGMNNVQVIG